MRLPHPRFSLRWMMIGVAVVGIMLGFEITRRRQEGFLSMARLWDNTEFTSRQAADSTPGPHGDPVAMRRLAEYAHNLRMKYERAARYPWLPVEPDPPEP
jgi:hypothetical protein